MAEFLGIDAGGTTIKYALVSDAGELSHEGSFPTQSENAVELLNKFISIAQEYKEKYSIQGIGVSCPGVIHPYEGRALWANNNMPAGWHEVQIKNILEEVLSVPVIVDNDVNCAALGEKWLGAGRDYHTFICIAMGTGIGSGIIINNSLYYGANFRAGEVGYIHSNVGTTLFWERKASTLSLVNRVQDTLRNSRCHIESEINLIDGKWIFENKNNHLVGSVLEDWAKELAKGISDIACVLNPQAVILGGGVSAQKDILLDLLIPKIKTYMPSGFTVDIKIAETGNNAGKLGAVKRLIDEHLSLKVNSTISNIVDKVKSSISPKD